MARIVVIGDLHGKSDQYQKMLRQKYNGVRTIQIGDFGIGFPGVGIHKFARSGNCSLQRAEECASWLEFDSCAKLVI
jgi:hypothetical protein